MKNKLNLKFKIWLENDGKAFGDGPYQLLIGVNNLGSLRKAAQDMNMSYSLAHKLIKSLEVELGYPLIERTVGGAGGGGSSLTKEAKDLMQNYHSFIQEAEAALNQLFHKYFAKTNIS
ncbi:LysR family transcriptional regulator [Clostridia bacterium]|nr:LysR family transcriptional regulator [Clostridia bacterium]